MNKYQYGINLINDGKIEDAYNYFTQLVNENPKDENALYLKIQTMEFLGVDPNEILEQYYILLKIMKKFNNEIYYKIAMTNNRIENYDEAIKYAKKAIIGDDNISINCHYILAVAYFFKNQPETVAEALNEINISIDYTEDFQELEFYYSLKIDILDYLKKYEQMEKLINEIYFKINKLEIVKELEAKILIARDAHETLVNENYDRRYLKETKKVFEDYLKINPKNSDIMKTLYNINIDLELFEDAKLLLEKLKSIEPISEREIIEEEFFLADKINKCEGIEKKYQELKEIYPTNWVVPYCAAYYLEDYCKFKEDYLKLYEYSDLGYQMEENLETLRMIVISNYGLKKYQENVNLMERYLEEHEETPMYNHLLANAYHYANYPYDLIDHVLDKEYQSYNFNDDKLFDRMFTSEAIIKKPTIFKPYFNLIYKKFLNQLNDFQLRKMIIKMIYGLNINKIDYKQALKLIEKQQKNNYEISCLYAIKGQIYERILNNNIEAFNNYKQAYEIFLKDDEIDKCTCPIAYMAHSYLNGIGVNKDEDAAKKLIFDAINTYEDDVNGNIIYLYAYLYLTDKIEADYKEIIRLLRLNKAFNRYEITREVLIEQVCKKANIINDYAVEGLKNALKYDSILAKKYYKKNKNNLYYYPFINSY